MKGDAEYLKNILQNIGIAALIVLSVLLTDTAKLSIERYNPQNILPAVDILVIEADDMPVYNQYGGAL